MATQVGEAVVKLTFDGKDAKASLTKTTSEVDAKAKEMSGSFGKIGTAVKQVGKVIGTSIIAGTAIATGAVASMVSSATKNFAEYEQLVGGVETLFKDSADTIFKYADNAYKTAGLSANEYMQQATSFSARLIQGLGGDTKKASEYANKAIVDMSDNANKMGTDISLIQSAYQGFAKQNYTMLDNLKLGYGGTAGEMARLINDSGVLGDKMKVTAKNVNEVSFDTMIEAIHRVQDNLGITGTTAKEASDTIQGSVNSMKKAWQNMLTGMSDDTQDFPTLVSNFVDTLGDVLKNIGPVIKTALKGVSKLVGEIGPMLAEMIPDIVEDILPSVISSIFTLAQAIIAKLPEIITMILNAIAQNLPTMTAGLAQTIVDLVVSLATSIADNLPIIADAITQAVIQLAMVLTNPENLTRFLEAWIKLFLAVIQAIPDIIVAIIDAMPQIIDNIITWLTSPETIGMMLDASVKLWTSLVEAVPKILGALLKAFGNLVGKLWDWITKSFGKFAGKFGNFLGNIFKGAINGVLSFLEKFINGPIDLINGFLDVINGAFGWVGVHIDHLGRISLPRLAEGGYADGATTAIIGEAGKEVVLPLENNTDNWAGLLAGELAKQFDKTESVGGREIIVNMTNNINNDMDAEDIGRKLMESIRRAA